MLNKPFIAVSGAILVRFRFVSGGNHLPAFTVYRMAHQEGITMSKVVKFGGALALVFGLTNMAVAAQDHTHHAAHVHGVGNLEVVQDGNTVFIALESPLYNVLGFEHAPKTDAQRVLARRVSNLLKANGLFSLTRDAQCRRSSHKLVSEVLNPHTHEKGHDHSHDHSHSHSHNGTHSEHADFRAEYEFECRKPELLTDILVRVFQQFSGFTELHVQAVLPSGQVGATLTPNQTTLVLKK